MTIDTIAILVDIITDMIIGTIDITVDVITDDY
jgi:hypothetical protein